MEFLRSKSVRMNRFIHGKENSKPLFTSYDMEQKVYVDMSKDKVEKCEVVISFDTAHPAPKKVSISANQYTLSPFGIEISMYKKHARKPYAVVKMEELNTILTIEGNTTRIAFSFKDNLLPGHAAMVKLGVNYVEF